MSSPVLEAAAGVELTYRFLLPKISEAGQSFRQAQVAFKAMSVVNCWEFLSFRWLTLKTISYHLAEEAGMTAHHHSGNFGLDGLKLMVGGLAIAFVLTGCGAARTRETRGATTVGLSGLEVFSGKTGASAPATLFAGKDNEVCNCWTASDNGGVWTASVSYAGHPGIGSSGVSVTDGKWSWQQAGDVIHFGKVKEGRVSWPASADADPFGCGKGVASVSLSLTGLSEQGAFMGCLDDTHLDPRAEPFVFPPKMWGTLTLQRN